MNKALDSSRANLSENAPQIVTIKIPKDKIGEVIGPAGKNIREILKQLPQKLISKKMEL